jgi:tetratricopeptide (TPR) repeat protein
MRLILRLALAIPAVLLASYAGVETVRFACAERLSHRDTVEALQAALRMTPGNADYYARIATLDPSRDDELRVALALNPRDPSWWIMSSVSQEEAGDVAGAEKSLRQANMVSRYYTPRWSLAAFYYRHGNNSEFIKWARSALSVGYGLPESLYQMAQKLGFPSNQILDDLLPAVPERVDSYLHLLLQQGKVEQEYAAAAQLLRIGSKENRSSVLETCESLFIADQIDQAVALWNSAIQVRWMDLSPLDPLSGKSLGDGSFAGEALELGFDWKSSIPSGISTSRSVPDRSLYLEFSGSQPEAGELISQFVPLLPNRHYQLQVHYRLRPTHSESGLQWSVLPVPSGKPLMVGLMNLSSETFVEQSFLFETPPQQGPMRILLSYIRLPGTTRMEGTLWIQSAQLNLLP